MRCLGLLGLTLVACRGPAPEAPARPAPREPAAAAATLDAPRPAPPPPSRFETFFEVLCEAEATAQAAMLAPDFIGQALFVAGDGDPKTAHEASGLIVADVGTRLIVPTFPMCETAAATSYEIGEDGRGVASVNGWAYRVEFSLDPLLLTHLLLRLPPDPTAGTPPPPEDGEVFISTMQVPSAPISPSLQRKLETFLVQQRACVDAYAATTEEPIGASVDLVVPLGAAPYLSARTVAELGVLACFEARLADQSWAVEHEARLLLHYGVPVSGPTDGAVIERVSPG